MATGGKIGSLADWLVLARVGFGLKLLVILTQLSRTDTLGG
jgi:hypothetical protein